MSTLHCSIDGVEIACEAGTTILEAARQNGIEIPSLCYLKDIHKLGACRICVVEVEGMSRLMSSCITPVREGMKIQTGTERVIAARRQSLDLICRRHRMDCEYCPDYTFCELHALVRRLGLDDRKYSQLYHPRRADESSRCIVRDNSKCIRCRRCVSTCKRQAVEAIGPLFRGEQVENGALLPIAETNCIGCGQCVRNCPTGALFVKDDTDLLWRAQNNRKKIVIGIMPETAENIRRFFGARTQQNEMERLAAVCRKVGAYAVWDLTGLRAFAVSELAEEWERHRAAGVEMAVSICPAERGRSGRRTDILWGREPEAIFRERAVELLREKGISEDELFVVYVSPCTAAKRAHVSDAVLTTVELFQWIQRACVSRFTALEVWNRTAGEAALAPWKDVEPLPTDVGEKLLYVCPGGCANGGGQFRANACQR